MKKNTLKNIGQAVLVSAVVVPALGVLAHVGAKLGAGNQFDLNDASLAHRFECAYTLNPKQTTYESWSYVPVSEHDRRVNSDGRVVVEDGVLTQSYVDTCAAPGYERYVMPERYAAHPLFTGLMYVGVGALAYGALRRRDEEAAAMQNAQKTR